MKIVLIFALCSLIWNFPVECENPLVTIQSYLIKMFGNSETKHEPLASTDAKGNDFEDTSSNDDDEEDPSTEPQFDSLPLALYKSQSDQKKMVEIVANKLFFSEYFKDELFIDIIFVCPRKQITIDGNNQQEIEKNTKQILVIKKNYEFFEKQREKQAEESQRDNSNNNNGEENSSTASEVKQESEKIRENALEDAKNFKCRDPIQPYMIRSLKQDPDGLYTVYLAGFEIDLRRYKKDLTEDGLGNSFSQKYRYSWSFTIVFDHSKLKVVCVHYEIQDNKDLYSQVINESFDDHDFGREILFRDVDIVNLYEKENQEKVFVELFENETERKNYFDPENDKILERVHLAPLDGFISPVTRQSAKTYGNVAPMWKVIKKNAWRRVELFISFLTTFRNFIELTIVSGTYGTLKLDGHEVFLSNNEKLPVPLAYWKLVLYGLGSKGSRGIFIVTVNNPYQDIGNIICEQDECAKYGWNFIQETNHAYGRTICCAFPYKIIEEIPILFGSIPDKVLNLKDSPEIQDSLVQFGYSNQQTTSDQADSISDNITERENVKVN